MVPRSSDRISRVPPYLICPIELPIRGCHPLWPDFPVCSRHSQGSAGPRSLATTSGVSVDFLSSGYLDVSVPRVRFFNPMCSGQRYLVIQTVLWSPIAAMPPPALSRRGASRLRSKQQNVVRWVSPFGDPWIKAYSQLPMAYRRVSRPSSPLIAKASTKRPFRAWSDPEKVNSLVGSHILIRDSCSLKLNFIKLMKCFYP